MSAITQQVISSNGKQWCFFRDQYEQKLSKSEAVKQSVKTFQEFQNINYICVSIHHKIKE